MLAAKRAGIRKLILPRENKESLADFPPDILADMEFTFVDNVHEVLDLILLPGQPQNKGNKQNLAKDSQKS
jgi:ATP-dependent Lon protease